MHLLIIHPETRIGGAEKMLDYFLTGLSGRAHRVTVASADGPLRESPGQPAEKVIIPDHGSFSLSRFLEQVRQLNRRHRQCPFDIVHGWAARDWELAGLLGVMWGKPAVGTLHDHPTAYYIRGRRRWLMRSAASLALRRVVCVSDAVRRACEEAGYPKKRLVTIHNGLPGDEFVSGRSSPRSRLALGYLGGLTRGKGIEDLLQIMDRVSAQTAVDWELRIAGAPLTKNDESWLQQLKARYAQRSWWPRTVWLGWVDRSADFLGSLDLLLFASVSFDSLPTVLLEAAFVGTPVLASAVGGAPEIVEHGLTGWLFPPGNCAEASALLARILDERFLLAQAGAEARKRVAIRFSVQKMVEAYENLYLTLNHNG